MLISAKINFMSNTEVEGRYTSPVSGFKPQLKIENIQTSCIVIAKDTNIKTMEFGVEYEVFLEPIFYEEYKDKIDKLFIVELYEGSKLIGKGVVNRE